VDSPRKALDKAILRVQNRDMKTNFTPEQRQELKQMHRKTKSRHDADKIKAILLFDDNYSPIDIANILLMDDETIRTWIKAYEAADTMEIWLERNYLAYQGKLNKEEMAKVDDFVSRKVISDSKEVKHYIEESFSKTYSLSGITSLLKRLGFVYKKTTLVPSKFDPIRQEQFKNAYEDLEEDLISEEVILFMDGVHPQHNTACTRAWVKKGETKEVKSNTGRARLTWNGVYNPKNQDVLLHESKTINAEEVLVFLKKIEHFYPEKQKIHVILDNARYYRNQKVTEYLQTSRIEFLFLPPYSPNLNLIERLWKFMRKKVINNRYYEKFSEFKKALMDFAKDLTNQRDELRQFIGTKMHLLKQVEVKTTLS
jgi:transposase